MIDSLTPDIIEKNQNVKLSNEKEDIISILRYAVIKEWPEMTSFSKEGGRFES